jgi:rRNA maturation RNase YbeY
MHKNALLISNETSLALKTSDAELSNLINRIEEEEKVTFSAIEYAFVDEDSIVEINKDFLKKDYVTDIITFRLDDFNEEGKFEGIEGSICICLARVIEQARDFDATEKQELMRVCAHGLLHLSGYEDSNEEQKKLMREKENYYLRKMNLL